MANRNKALLDALMGSYRNDSTKDKQNREPQFLQDEVCKDFLVGYCPCHALGKVILATQHEFDKPSILRPCKNIHVITARDEFNTHPDKEKYLLKWQISLHKLMEKALVEIDDKLAHERRKREAMKLEWSEQDRECDICGLKYKLRESDVNVRDVEGQRFKPDLHDQSDIHKGYVKLRQKFAELDAKLPEIQAKIKEREDKDREEKDSKKKDKNSKDSKNAKDSKSKHKRCSSSRSRSRSKRKETNGKGGKSRSRSKKKDKNGKDSTSRSRSKRKDKTGKDSKSNKENKSKKDSKSKSRRCSSSSRSRSRSRRSKSRRSRDHRSKERSKRNNSKKRRKS
eukprot:TRINITY_DN103562_c0_g1_i1.p1 TRINITY_DN103562_c0_g1~~TRINITY_DN103562_c0_g1_i1.p1  ORF type:complete len:339 (+),score=77.26 TRINITY_DN103562_c0_g1_i1:157-1173(+)